MSPDVLCRWPSTPALNSLFLKRYLPSRHQTPEGNSGWKGPKGLRESLRNIWPLECRFTKKVPLYLNVNPLRFRALWILQAVRSWGLLTFASQFYGTLNFFSLETGNRWTALFNDRTAFDKRRLRCAGSSRRISHKDPRIKKTSSIPCTQRLLQNETPKELKII